MSFVSGRGREIAAAMAPVNDEFQVAAPLYQQDHKTRKCSSLKM